MQIIPLQPVPSQLVTVQLSGQVCQIKVYQKFYGLFCDVSVNNTLIIGGVLCLNLNRIKRSDYLAFIGDLFFNDTQGTADPHYTGLGSRFNFMYLDASDLLYVEGP